MFTHICWLLALWNAWSMLPHIHSWPEVWGCRYVNNVYSTCHASNMIWSISIMCTHPELCCNPIYPWMYTVLIIMHPFEATCRMLLLIMPLLDILGGMMVVDPLSLELGCCIDGWRSSLHLSRSLQQSNSPGLIDWWVSFRHSATSRAEKRLLPTS